MGNCRSKNGKVDQKNAGNSAATNTAKEHDLCRDDSDGSKSFLDGTASSSSIATADDNTDTTAALVQALIPIALPIVRRALCQQLVGEGLVLRDEEPVLSLDDNASSDTDLPLGPIEVHMASLQVADAKSVLRDMELDPEFKWPEHDRVEELMQQQQQVPGSGVGMVVLDLIQFEATVHFGKGIELALPVEGPMGMTATIEVGTGGEIADAWVKLCVPKLRVWFVTESSKMYVAFMERPDIVPRLHVNVDRGKGDFLNMAITEKSTLDDVVEKTLSGFGPNLRDPEKNEESKGGWKKTFSKSWVVDAIGEKISAEINRAAGMGNGSPIEIDLKEQVDSAVCIALGKPRPAEQIRADMKILDEELARSLAHESKPPGSAPKVTKADDANSTNTIAADNEEVQHDPGQSLLGASSCATFEPITRFFQ